MTESPFTSSDEFAVIERYSERLSRHGHSPLSVGWGPKDRQRARFAVLASNWDLHGKRILDIGAGFGDLYGFLKHFGISRYLGVDIVPGLVETGQATWGGDDRFQLVQADFLKHHIDTQFDVAFVSGTFNFKLANGRNYEFIEAVLTKAFRLCDVGVCANFITDRADFQEDLIFYANESKVLSTCFKLTRRVSLRADYFPFEFSVFLHRDDRFLAETSIFSSYAGERMK